MSILVIAEHDNVALRPATAATIAAALSIDVSVDVLVAGSACQAVANEAAALQGVKRVLQVDAPHYEHPLAENLAALVVAHASAYSHILAPASTFGKNLLPRVAALLDVAQVSDVCAIEAADIFVHPVYAGNALETVQCTDAVKVLSIRATAFAGVGEATTPAPVESLECGPDLALSRFVSRTLAASDRPELGASKVVVSGGRGLGSAEHFAEVLTPLADALDAALGASRAAVDAGFAPNDWQVGQTGKVVAPDLYIAVAISGAIQHLAGMKESKVIVAINKDTDAAIFQVADYGLVADLFDAVPELVAALKH